ncbi:MAG: Na/Pi cotransporter family protein [Chelatococcus sp.]|jgi:phosphate:Na+ symporter|uniref:Na/Pi cotransporter family protein n=1 Tax=unclassified Chelatococcus TaxID=2638111 RepID=UPI001BCFBA49|nr:MULTISPECIES: Na/Pi cotransporter family protein [unclassified Chelatococcus]CAH1664395.1 Phosphate:Na+ symporter [Hyphomicrobiales bacterium]MBS7741696.1 Na/Pi cotransporter family protein [Chelatococcus sp. HY11]MBX3538709.1 Na/Pi cotransporter family protein [Chelatococcus sp.]MBX3544285.1 Na/Pi cotransporter family protein [Chelatococcus sp.]MCO5079392.1 Na/Pi cotransporter family protein [Chelatococcus sp.]
MAISFALINLAGYVALLLWGTHMVQTGVQRAFGPHLRTFLGSALRNRLSAFLAGLGVTAVLQSSTATGLMVTGFAADGLVRLMPALAVMLGANVGTTLIVQVLSFDVAAFAPGLILFGVVMFRRDSSTRLHDLGRVFIGLGLILIALHQMLTLMAPFENAPGLKVLLGAVSTLPIIDVLLGIIVTWAFHSSVAVVLLIMSLATNGVIPPEAAIAFVIGANIGTAVNPVLEGTTSDDPAAKRLPIGNLLNRIVGGVIALALIDPISGLMVRLDGDAGRMVADFHTFFNLVIAAVFFPFLGPYSRFLEKILPERAKANDPAQPIYLDNAAKETPIVALGSASREALRLADMLENMLRGARDALAKDDRKIISETKRLDDILDSLNTAIKTYLTSIDPEELSDADHRRLNEVLAFTMNLEQAGDVIDRNLLPHASKRLKRGLTFSKEGQEELLALMDRLIANLRTAASLFMTEDARAARLLAEEKVAFRDAENAATGAHFARLRTGRLDTTETSSLHLDLLRDIKLINSHIVAAAAYPVLERTGDLLPSRIAATGE